MGQLTLNLIAISIFCVTMAALVGPLIHLSPVVPTVAIATLLGIATLDQAAGQGTLGHLVVGSLGRFTPDQRQRILHHEAGHFLTAALLEIPIQDYTLSPWEAWRKGFPGQGGVQFDTAPLTDYARQGQIPAQVLNRYSIVWMAGIAAEEWLHGSAVGGQGDRQGLTLLWRQLGRSPQSSAAHQRWALLQARTLLETHQEVYQSLIAAFEAKKPVADCLALVTSQPETQEIIPNSPGAA